MLLLTLDYIMRIGEDEVAIFVRVETESETLSTQFVTCARE